MQTYRKYEIRAVLEHRVIHCETYLSVINNGSQQYVGAVVDNEGN